MEVQKMEMENENVKAEKISLKERINRLPKSKRIAIGILSTIMALALAAGLIYWLISTEKTQDVGGYSLIEQDIKSRLIVPSSYSVFLVLISQ